MTYQPFNLVRYGAVALVLASLSTLGAGGSRNSLAAAGSSEEKRSIVNIVLSVEEVGPQGSRSCSPRPEDRRSLNGPDGLSWQKGSGTRWCAYRANRLSAEWRENAYAAGRVLSFTRAGAVIRFSSPRLAGASRISRESCASADPGATVASGLALPFGPLMPCSAVTSEDQKIAYGIMPTDAGELPYLTVTREGAASKATVVYLAGGPYLNNFARPSEAQSLMHLVHTPGITVVVPFYLGTGRLFVEGANNIALATDQIEALLDRLEARSDGQPVCVVGGSLGGYIAAGLKYRPSMHLLLLNPLLSSPRTMVERLSRQPALVQAKRSLNSLGSEEWSSSRYLRSTSRETQSVSAFLAYFGTGARKTLVDRLLQPPANIRVLYGAADERIGLDYAPELRRLLGPERVTDVGAVGHTFDEPANYWAFEPHVASFLSECVKAPSRASRQGAGEAAVGLQG